MMKTGHSGVVRATHWIITVCFLSLLVSGIEIVISHPRFYWGEAGNVTMTPLFTLPIPASRGTVPTGFGFVLPDQNGWSRGLHFQAAWVVGFTALVYGVAGFVSGHFGRDLFGRAGRYGKLQRRTYAVVIVGLFPLMIWTGLAMAPGITAAFPWVVTILGGQQSARTIHFAVTGLLVAFVVGHVAMVAKNGFVRLTRAMITGGEV